MSGTSTDMRKRRLRFRAWHRGMRELDLLLGPFADDHLAAMTERELVALERIMELPDPELYAVISGRVEPPAALDRELVRRIGARHSR